MSNYILDNSIDFYGELNKIINDEEFSENQLTDSETCLITNEPLEKHSIKLDCNHCFNYIPLFNDVKNQKRKFFASKSSIGGCDLKLTLGQMKCPLCRNVQNNIMPYIPEVVKEKIYGVNNPQKFCRFLNECKYKFISGKRKGHKCGKKCNDDYCSTHSKVKEENHSIQTVYCSAVLTTGKRAGKTCGCIAKYNGLCGRHKK